MARASSTWAASMRRPATSARTVSSSHRSRSSRNFSFPLQQIHHGDGDGRRWQHVGILAVHRVHRRHDLRRRLLIDDRGRGGMRPRLLKDARQAPACSQRLVLPVLRHVRALACSPHRRVNGAAPALVSIGGEAVVLAMFFRAPPTPAFPAQLSYWLCTEGSTRPSRGAIRCKRPTIQSAIACTPWRRRAGAGPVLSGSVGRASPPSASTTTANWRRR
jgi:hypothetical protein